ncbi:TatD family hydrolase [Paenimyroides aestuarii]|uniref:TatD family hydrolase n=1 Tax=Paenimyroides aestuarii TaxID=2968490 RepID=A0ABY5NPS6_9FLAO|nr:TatD family hydrolase [Paenimyroides aestuarii]UUV20550.1 TatD family hydrolase [Paenimyroides aestuarii]
MYYNIHTHHFSNNNEIVELVNQYPNEINTELPHFTVGIHPWYINEENFLNDMAAIEHAIHLPNFKAVGECGLDKRITTSIEIQKKIVIPQLLLAEKHKKPVILHCVAAYQEIIEIKKDLKLTIPMIIHGFSKNSQVAESLVNNGFYLSFGKYLLQNPDLEMVLKTIPLNRLFFETDMIDQTIFEVYSKAKSVLNINLEPIIAENYNRVFNQ